MKWFARHPQWLYRETSDLQRISEYQEHFQLLETTLISTGDIILYKEKKYCYPILIVYPEATFYQVPTVYILQNNLTEDFSRELSTLAPLEIGKRIQSNIKVIHRRHQNSDGSLCFLETESIHEDTAQAYGIKDILKRVRLWLLNRIPKDSAEVEFFAHFNNKTHDLQYLLPDIFFDTDIIKGRYFASKPAVILTNNYPNKNIKETFMGVTIIGETPDGITLPPKVYLRDQVILFTRIPDIDILLLDENKQTRAKEIDSGNLIEGYWWDIDREPEPFGSIQELAKYIGGGNQTRGIEQLISELHPLLQRLSDEIHIGIRFPGRRREKDWQMFRLKRGSRTPIMLGKLKEIEDQKELTDRLLDHSIEAVYQEYFTDADYHMRNRGRADRGALSKAEVSVIGCGAIGSETADALAKAGVGSILLADKESMRANNSVRHILGLDSISSPKSTALYFELLKHNPFINLDAIIIDILKDSVDKYIPDNSMGISTIADDNVESYLNEQAVTERRTVFYCRALRGAKAARIFRVIPFEDACKTCLSIYRNDKKLFIDIEEDEELPVITNECNNPVRPASSSDLKIIAGLFSRIIIDFLEGKHADKNHFIWSTESLSGLELPEGSLGSLSAQHIPPHPNCPTCQRLEDKTAFIVKDVYDFMKAEVQTSGEVETGGVLMGHFDNGQYFIERASGPGPNAVKTRTRFEKDIQYCQEQLGIALNELGDQGLYIGEWHYHPTGGSQPSGTDIKSLTEIANQDDYRIEKPIMVIFSPSLECALTIHDKTGEYFQLPLKQTP